ncbi:integral membrane protein [Salmonella enterica]|uniref:Integral membrane protein n=1 Tax=Salmonella enterica TaxID=28901 RepID=A0A7D8ELE2_SALER|nr:integral membrane protein [Salmonella enterica]
MREMNFSQRLRRFIVRKNVQPPPTGCSFTKLCVFLLENKQPLKTALEQMRDAWTDFGRKWHPFAELATDCIESLRENSGENSLEYTLGLWVPPGRGCSNQCRNKKWFHCGCITICHHTYRCQKATPSGHMANGYLPGGVVNHDDGDIICS